MSTLWLRPEGSHEIGLGHVMRMVALAQAAQARGMEPCFVMQDHPVAVDLPARFGFPVLSVDRWPWRLEGAAVVFDGYHFDAADHLDASERGAVVGAMDDTGTGRYEVDVLVNQNLVTGLDVQLPRHAVTLLGPRYALIRNEFLKCRGTPVGEASRLLITLGGTDTQGLARYVADAVIRTQLFDEVLLLAGRAAIADAPSSVEVVRDPESVATVFASVDAAVSAAGSTTWELLCCGVPTALIQTEDNQRHIARPLAGRGAALFLGEDRDLDVDMLQRLADRETRHALSRAGRELVDGLGARRVVDSIVSLLRHQE